MTRLMVRLGELNILEKNKTKSDKDLLEVVLHPKFDNLTKENDIALLRVSDEGLKFQVQFSPNCKFQQNSLVTFTAQHTSYLFARDGQSTDRREWLGDWMGKSSEGEEVHVQRAETGRGANSLQHRVREILP